MKFLEKIEPIDFMIGGLLAFLLLRNNSKTVAMKMLPDNFIEIANSGELTVIYTESGMPDGLVKSNIEKVIKKAIKQYKLKKVNFFFTDTNVVHNSYNAAGFLGDVFFISPTKFSVMRQQQVDENIMYSYAQVVLD